MKETDSSSMDMQPAHQDVVLAQSLLEKIEAAGLDPATSVPVMAKVLHVVRLAREESLRQNLRKFGGKHAGHVLGLQAKDKALVRAYRNMRVKLDDVELLKSWLEELGVPRHEIALKLKNRPGSPPPPEGQKPTRRQVVLLACYRLIEEAIYDEDGMDGSRGQELLEAIEPLLTEVDQVALKQEAVTREAQPAS